MPNNRPCCLALALAEHGERLVGWLVLWFTVCLGLLLVLTCIDNNL